MSNLALFLNMGCYQVQDELNPQVQLTVPDRHLKSLPAAFLPLNSNQKNQDWGKEHTIGMGFARELDLYQAITAFKRSLFLISPSEEKEIAKLKYYILLAYYLGQKYLDVSWTFETSLSHFSYGPSDFPPYHDILVMLYDSYSHLKNDSKAEQILNYMKYTYPETHQKMEISEAIMKGNVKKLIDYSSSYSEVNWLLYHYHKDKKSPLLAQTLNGILPGSGYLYLGQKQSALTAFLVNGLCIWASVYCFQHHNIGAGCIFASIEAGWYFGGIYGAGLEAKLYNERVYEKYATPVVYEKNYLPILMLNYAF